MDTNNHTYLHLLLNDLRELMVLRAYDMKDSHKRQHLFLIGVHLHKLTGDCMEALREVMHLNGQYNKPLGQRALAPVYDRIATMGDKELEEYHIELEQIAKRLQITEDEKAQLEILGGDTWAMDSQRLMDAQHDMPKATDRQLAKHLGVDMPTLLSWKERLDQEQNSMLTELFMQAM